MVEGGGVSIEATMSEMVKTDKLSRSKIHFCLLLSESDQITDLAALPYTLTHSESWSRFRVWWLGLWPLFSGKIASGLP